MLRMPLVHLDDLYWEAGWRRPHQTEWIERLRRAVGEERWLIDGNYLASARLRAENADAVIIVCAPATLCLWRTVCRAMGIMRGRTEDLPRAVREQGQAGAAVSAIHDFGALSRKVIGFHRRELPKLGALLLALPERPIFLVCHDRARRAVDRHLPAKLTRRAQWVRPERAAETIRSLIRTGAGETQPPLQAAAGTGR